VPQPADPAPPDDALLAQVETAVQESGQHIAGCRFRAGIETAMSAARAANRYLEEQAPWRLIEEDRQRCATVIYTALSAINSLKMAFYPYLPFTSQRLHGHLGYKGSIDAASWRCQRLQPGQTLARPEPLYRKLEPSLIEEEEARLGR